jgi:hypothetical protein
MASAMDTAALSREERIRMSPFDTENEIVFFLPIPGWPQALFQGDFGYRCGRLLIDDRPVLSAASRAELEGGVRRLLAPYGEVEMRLVPVGARHDVCVTVAGRPARRASDLRARPSRSAWIHACQALAGSGAGFAASWLYLQKAAALGSDWALKMGDHMAGWHFLLTCTLFPASVWGQRTGIRVVQGVSLLFFFIHAGIAIANIGPLDPSEPNGVWIAGLSAVSGLLFLVAAMYGNRAYRDMDPVRALRGDNA